MKHALVFQSDFGYVDGAVSAMYGVAFGVDPTLNISNLTHEITPYDIWEASYRLIQTVSYWPAGTVFVSVVDPGVGTKRRACVAKTVDGYYIVTPDNGALTHIKKFVGIEAVREIDETVNRLQSTRGVAIFHGRDLFGYTAARLASGIIDFEGVGPEYPVEEIVEHPIYEPDVQPGKVSGYDHFLSSFQNDLLKNTRWIISKMQPQVMKLSATLNTGKVINSVSIISTT